jgi:hypothetical protein
VPDATRRPRLGEGRLRLRRELSVFINCPFDAEYKPVFDAIVFATVCCGFLPRCADETGNVAESRMRRITKAMLSSKYSVHDLSRCRGEGDANLARFNMPLELGMAMAQRFRGKSGETKHDWLLLVPQGHSYKKFVSDLAGYDVREHDGTPRSAVPPMMAWLATRTDAVCVPTPQAVLSELPALQAANRELDQRWEGCAPWTDLIVASLSVAQKAGLIPPPARMRG